MCFLILVSIPMALCSEAMNTNSYANSPISNSPIYTGSPVSNSPVYINPTSHTNSTKSYLIKNKDSPNNGNQIVGENVHIDHM